MNEATGDTFDMEMMLPSIEEMERLKIVEKCNRESADFADITGALINGDGTLNGYKVKEGRQYVDSDGKIRSLNLFEDANLAITPIIKSHALVSSLEQEESISCVTFGEYPQNIVDISLQKKLEDKYQNGVIKPREQYFTTNGAFSINKDGFIPMKDGFIPMKHFVYNYDNKKYIRVIANTRGMEMEFTNGVTCKHGDFIWVEVNKINWIVDKKNDLLYCGLNLISGIPYCKDTFNLHDIKYEDSFIREFLNNYVLPEMMQSPSFNVVKTDNMEKTEQKEINPYNLEFDKVSEEDLIRSSIESDIPVFLHGKSSDGKSARIKAIDPNLEIIYLRNATPDSLNGKSVYNSNDNKMIDIKPSWLERLENKCSREPDKIHILFFDELTNSLPSIQGMAFNIILDREVNARIVAAGNEMSDSLAANKMAEPLFNRFAHVYIKTNTKSWLVWASNSNIHPAIFSFIAYKKDKALRTEYNGETPNADPRKWEMASKMLYKTNNPESLRCLVGSDITREFIAFCKTKVITLDDVLNDRVTDDDINSLNVASKYATVVGLTSVSSKDSKKVRKFLFKLGAEYRSLFDSLRINSDDELEELMEEEMRIRKM